MRRKSRPPAITLAEVENNDWDAQYEPGPPGKVWLRIPKTPPSLNVWTRKHWALRQKIIARYTENLKFLAMREKLPKFEKAEVRITYYFRDSRKRDPDNYTPKQLLDALRYAGVLADDNAGVLRLPQPEFRVDSKRPRTEVEIAEWR